LSKIADFHLPSSCIGHPWGEPLEFCRDLWHQKTTVVPCVSIGVVYVIVILAVMVNSDL